MIFRDCCEVVRGRHRCIKRGQGSNCIDGALLVIDEAATQLVRVRDVVVYGSDTVVIIGVIRSAYRHYTRGNRRTIDGDGRGARSSRRGRGVLSSDIQVSLVYARSVG